MVVVFGLLQATEERGMQFNFPATIAYGVAVSMRASPERAKLLRRAKPRRAWTTSNPPASLIQIKGHNAPFGKLLKG